MAKLELSWNRKYRSNYSNRTNFCKFLNIFFVYLKTWEITLLSNRALWSDYNSNWSYCNAIYIKLHSLLALLIISLKIYTIFTLCYSEAILLFGKCIISNVKKTWLLSYGNMAEFIETVPNVPVASKLYEWSLIDRNWYFNLLKINFALVTTYSFPIRTAWIRLKRWRLFW